MVILDFLLILWIVVEFGLYRFLFFFFILGEWIKVVFMVNVSLGVNFLFEFNLVVKVWRYISRRLLLLLNFLIVKKVDWKVWLNESDCMVKWIWELSIMEGFDLIWFSMVRFNVLIILFFILLFLVILRCWVSFFSNFCLCTIFF